MNPIRRSPLPLVVMLLASLAHPLSATAATRHWDGGGTKGFWDTAANWSNNVAAIDGDTLFFPTNVARLVNTNRASGNLTNLSAIRITGNGYNIFSVPSINLTNGLTNAALIGSANTLNAALHLRRNQTWAVGGRTTLTLNSNVNWTGIFLTNDLDGTLICNGNFIGSGGAQLTKTGSGALELSGAGNQVPTVRVLDGTLQVDGALTATTLVISNSATLSGSGSATAFTCAGDFQPGGSGVGTFTMTGAGSAAFQAGSRFFANINGLVPGTDYDQFKTPSTPNLSGAQLIVLRSFSFPYAIGQKFVIITNTGAAAQSTTFANLAQNARLTNNGVVFQISYTGGSGNDVELTVVDAPFAPSGVTRTWDAGGGGNRFWKTAVNWDANMLPNRGDDLVFPASVPATGSQRILNNNLPATNNAFNRLAFGGQGASWIIQGGGLKIFGGVIATNALPLGDAAFGNSSVELIGPQTWGGTNMGITLNAPVLLGGHTLTLASAVGDAVRFQHEVLGPGTMIAASGQVSFFSQVGGSNVAVTIQGGDVFAGFGPFTGPAWQMSGGTLRPSSAQIPGLQATGGEIDLTGFSAATIAGNLNLSAACQFSVQFDLEIGRPLVVTGQIHLNGARLRATPADPSLIGRSLTILSNAGPGAVIGTFAGLSQGAVFATTNEANGLVSLIRISYVGGDGNDVTLTPVLPSPTGLTRVWTGAGANALWETTANWSGNNPPSTGDDARFPFNATQRTNTNSAPALVLNSMLWEGSDYLHSGTLSLLNGLRHDAASGKNSIVVTSLLELLSAQTWVVSNAAATLRLFQEVSLTPVCIAAAGGDRDGSIDGVGPVTKTGLGRLEIENVPFSVTGGLIVNGGTVRLQNVVFDKTGALALQAGRVEAVGVNVSAVIATNGELAIHFAAGAEEGVSGGLFSTSTVTLSSNATLAVHWTNGAAQAIGALGVKLDETRLNVTFPPSLPENEIIRIAQYPTDELTGTFANLPDGAVTDFGGRAWQIRYDVELPNESPNMRFILLEPPIVAPRFTSIERLGNGEVILRGTARPGATVAIEAANDLETFNPIGSTVANGAGQFTFIDGAGGFAQRFYQAVLPTP